MANEWFVEDKDRVTGPFTVAQMKAQAAASRIRPETRVRKGSRGRWIEARRVQGLLPAAEPSQGQSIQKRNPKPSRGREKSDVAPAAEGTFLAPLHDRKRRAIIWGCLIGFIAIGQSPLYQQLIFDLTVGLIIGSFPLIEVKKKSIEQTIFVLFFPVHRKTWRIREFVAVEAEVEPRASDQFGCLVYIFFLVCHPLAVFRYPDAVAGRDLQAVSQGN